MFITPSGLPVRVITSTAPDSAYPIVEETDVLAVDTSIDVKQPSPGQTIGEAEFVSLFFDKSRQCGFRTIPG
jgi:hypothetical protein